MRRYCDTPVIVCYPEEISQVWVNILNNALYAMNHKGVMEIDIRREEGGYGVSISNDGPQIPPEIRGRIFEPFFTTKKPGEGSGLGLDIVKRIVDRHGGTIGFTSVPEKTVFRVFLPDHTVWGEPGTILRAITLPGYREPGPAIPIPYNRAPGSSRR